MCVCVYACVCAHTRMHACVCERELPECVCCAFDVLPIFNSVFTRGEDVCLDTLCTCVQCV